MLSYPTDKTPPNYSKRGGPVGQTARAPAARSCWSPGLACASGGCGGTFG